MFLKPISPDFGSITLEPGTASCEVDEETGCVEVPDELVDIALSHGLRHLTVEEREALPAQEPRDESDGPRQRFKGRFQRARG